MNYIMRILKSLEKFCLLIKGVSKSMKNGAKEQKKGFSIILLGIY